ncbi:MAG: ABC transporter ATP-binding protein [Candidatus Paraimprobicoccus trichonymphae]|uniref:ABC transporter ATP-binding protein n=1 Tax=Candidatus Paraimprobicoccus trichonymphae TaxID=3033793 RepID=A0AA48HZ98_9FIRM|nr:MAG: ABC transporter ATP-binding protein [Candidatus Paraimprobicoccus trichonymphae]
MSSGEYVLKTQGLTKTFYKTDVVDDVNIEIQKGDIYGFIGKNGAGKTTTIKMIVGLSEPTKGKVQLFGNDNLNKGHLKLGTVIEYPALYPYMSAKENLETQRRLLGIEDKNRINEILTTVGLEDAGRKKAKNFSLGMKQRLAIGLALMGDPEFLFLDEPTNGLDPTGIKEIRNLILKLNKEKKITVLISSHILGELSKIANRYGVINKGKLVKQFHTSELDELIKRKVKLRVNNPEKTYELLSKELNINNYETSEDGTIFISDENVNTGKINSLLAENDIIIESISKESKDLEEYFISLMESKGGDQDV